jgi:maltose/moltooligosaccharide transporter
VLKTPEISPTDSELAEMRSEKKGLFQPFSDIFMAIKVMPKPMWQLALVYLFQWYAMMCYWQYISHSIAQSVWHTSSEKNLKLYEDAAAWTGLVNSFYNIITFLSAFSLVWLAKKYSAKILHSICLIMAAISLFIIPFIDNKYLLFAPMVGFGIAWASMMGVPYIMVANCIPKKRYGVYMGIVNMMIVIPMLIQNISFGFIYKHFLNNNPANAILFSGVMLLLASGATLLMKNKNLYES